MSSSEGSTSTPNEGLPSATLTYLTSTIDDLFDANIDINAGIKPSGLTILAKADVESLIKSSNAMAAQLREERVTTHSLRLGSTQSLSSSTEPSFRQIEKLYDSLLTVTNEKSSLTDQLAKTKEELRHCKQQVDKLQTKGEKLQDKYEALQEDYDYAAYDAKLAKRYKDIFRETLSDVYRAVAELRELQRRPRAEQGCLNCGIPGHSYRSCTKPYSGKFCQKCAHPDFSTSECPWPHFVNGPPGIPEHLKCKRCWGPLNAPDTKCIECIRRMMADNLQARHTLALRLEQQSSPSTAKKAIGPPGSNRTRSIPPQTPQVVGGLQRANESNASEFETNYCYPADYALHKALNEDKEEPINDGDENPAVHNQESTDTPQE
ncbi:uncharacterized protein LOC127276943 [Leptopilina boulardi]|uniref:uncharacterized protein LOC127276943 n=1 Tax=Leptopilina boulardi TaxID=63433 RepID=UPI0021F50717|nr:uncharacterized protein LOC127276943 [Leptopilina boulardi]